MFETVDGILTYSVYFTEVQVFNKNSKTLNYSFSRVFHHEDSMNAFKKEFDNNVVDKYCEIKILDRRYRSASS